MTNYKFYSQVTVFEKLCDIFQHVDSDEEVDAVALLTAESQGGPGASRSVLDQRSLRSVARGVLVQNLDPRDHVVLVDFEDLLPGDLAELVQEIRFAEDFAFKGKFLVRLLRPEDHVVRQLDGFASCRRDRGGENQARSYTTDDPH